ncbi:carboxypeptidase B2-like [Centroberyx affinis]|uniref:carboxypeptidase B2-like n=1 Tax=Centroberyx affinis TaxID=166261 RepID=UPI003A5C49CF
MKIFLVWAFLINSYSLFKTGDCASTHDQILSVRASTQEQVDILENITRHEELYESVLLQPVSPWHIKAEADVHLFVSASRSEAVMDLLQKHSISHQVLLNNTKELMELQTKKLPNATRSSSSFYESYHSLEEIYEWINEVALAYPDMVETFSIGSSFENRSLQVLKLSGEKKADKKAIWMDCGIHAREWISPAFCLWFVQHYLKNYKQDQNITHLLDNMDVYVLPVMNPDGYKYTWLHTLTSRNRMWRKNRSHRKGSFCTGVDLNRNFDANWCSEGASNNTCFDTYCGPAAHSEPETQALAEFLRNHSDSVQIYYTIHSYSQMLLFPFSYTRDKAPNHDELLGLVKEVAEKINASTGNTYKYGPGSETIYLAPGGSDDWAYDLGIKYAFTFELQDTGNYGFLLPPSHILQACSEALIAVQTIALRVIEKTKPDSP